MIGLGSDKNMILIIKKKHYSGPKMCNFGCACYGCSHGSCCSHTVSHCGPGHPTCCGTNCGTSSCASCCLPTACPGGCSTCCQRPCTASQHEYYHNMENYHRSFSDISLQNILSLKISRSLSESYKARAAHARAHMC